MSRSVVAALVVVGITVAAFNPPADAARKRSRTTTRKAAPTTTRPAPATTQAPPPTAVPKPLFAIGRSQLGEILVSTAGLTLYNFDPDARKPGGSACNSPCSDVWPPLTITSEADLVAPPGFTGKLGSVRRDDGSLQASVNGWPLYGWAFDKKPGDLNGQANNEVWWALDATGNVIRTAPTIRLRPNRLGSAATSTTPMMVGTTGGTLYMYEPDRKIGVSTCYDQCAIAWPPLLVNAKDDLRILQGHNIDASKVTVFPRADTNQLQVAYDGWPLYYWFRDNKPGDTTGQAVGNVWWVLDATGKPQRT